VKTARKSGRPLPLEEAERLLFSQVPAPTVEQIRLDKAAGHVLAEPAVADSDQPPFNRAMMDGYAVRSADGATRTLEEVDDIPAGKLPKGPIGPGQCARIMTGAAVPDGADAVQQIEKTRGANGRVKLLEPVTPGQNVGPRGSEARAGDVVLAAPRRLRPQDLAVLAWVGVVDVSVYRAPTCAVIATGDELVDASERPAPGQIRNTNSVALPAQIRRLGLSCDVLPRAPDRMKELRARIREGMERDVLILSGGVSAGDRDLVVPALEAEGVKTTLHQVLMRPGRPIFFGSKGRRVVFGLPGNPVSAFVTFEALVRPFLGRMMGFDGLGPRRIRARLAAPLAKKMERTVFWPALLSSSDEGPIVRTLPWKSSADLGTLARADALAIQPRGVVLEAQAWIDVLLLD
jgi:molybdopterin molybdotransferase